MVPVTLLDTSALPPQERDAATREFIGTMADLDAMEHACPPESIRTRARALGLDNFQMYVTDAPWLRYGLNGRAPTETVTIAAQVSGQAVMSHG